MYLGGPGAGQRENIPRSAWCLRPRCRPSLKARSARGTRQVRVRCMPSRDHWVYAGPNPGLLAFGRAARERRLGRERRRSDRRCEGGGGVALDHREGDKEGRALGRGDHLASGRGLGQVRWPRGDPPEVYRRSTTGLRPPTESVKWLASVLMAGGCPGQRDRLWRPYRPGSAVRTVEAFPLDFVIGFPLGIVSA